MTEENSTFAAEAFNSSSGNEAVEGRIIFDSLRLRFVSQAVNLEIPLVRLQIQPDETTEGRICFLSLDQPDWTICTFDARALQHNALLRQPHTRNQIREL